MYVNKVILIKADAQRDERISIHRMTDREIDRQTRRHRHTDRERQTDKEAQTNKTIDIQRDK